jgi:excisionase family DNA binding protein
MSPIAYTILEACAASGVGRTKIYEAIAGGHLTARKNGKRTLILEADLRRWIEGLPLLEPSPANVKRGRRSTIEARAA